ncbi:MAG TPA: DMT family transporter [Candidatus Saccharimonadales bacterium]|nr:DMT family transporter [Candidatus Saccharimonadales bacterium]
MLSYLPLIYVLLATFFWSLDIFVSKLGFLAGAKLIPFNLQSSAITFLILGIYVFLTKLKELKKVPSDVKIKLFFASAIHSGIGGFFGLAAVLYTTAINAAFLFQFTTVTTSILAWLILSEKMTRSKAFTIILEMFGIFLFITNGSLITPHFGDVLALITCVAWSTGNVLTRSIIKNNSVDADVATFFRPIGGLTLLILFILASPLYPQTLQSIFHTDVLRFSAFPYVFLDSLFVALLFIFLNRTLKVASASYMTLMASFSPIFVGVLSFIFLHETISTIQLFGAFFIIFGGIITQLLRIDKH